MFTTVEEVKELTNYDVTEETVRISQALIESYVGRVEAEVSKASDLMLLGRATAYQCAYSEGGWGPRTFEQAKLVQLMELGNMMSFAQDGVSPWIAPLAVIACRGLSWKRIRSIKTGSIFAEPVEPYRWEQD